MEVELLINDQLNNFPNQLPHPQPMDVDTPQPVMEQDVLQCPPQQPQPEPIPEPQPADAPVITQRTKDKPKKLTRQKKSEGCPKEQNYSPKNDERSIKNKVVHH